MRQARDRIESGGDGGFMLIEVLVAIAVLTIGIVATFGVFTSSKSTTLVAQRHEVGLHIAQREMENMRTLKYADLKLTGAAADAGHPDHPLSADNQSLLVKAGCTPACWEALVLPDGGSTGRVNPGPEPFTVGTGNAAVTGNIYRYVTWRDESCPGGECDGTQNTKRIAVAVAIDPVGNLGPGKPIWYSSIATNPNEGPEGVVEQNPAPPGVAGQSFFLYDRRCDPDDASNDYTPPTSSHDTHDTASWISAGGSNTEYSTCENTVASKRPDLAGPVTPNYSDPPVPPFTYSADLSGDYPAGLAMLHRGTTCPIASYTADDTQGKFSLHAWATRAFNSDFDLNGRAFLSFWTTSVGSAFGQGEICATLIDRVVDSNGVPYDDRVLGSTTYQFSPWPTTKSEPGKFCGTATFPCGQQISFSFNLTGTSVRSGARLVIVLSALGDSTGDKNVVLLYDDPRYLSFLQVETATPCQPQGTSPTPPCYSD